MKPRRYSTPPHGSAENRYLARGYIHKPVCIETVKREAVAARKLMEQMK